MGERELARKSGTRRDERMFRVCLSTEKPFGPMDGWVCMCVCVCVEACVPNPVCVRKCDTQIIKIEFQLALV